MEHTASTSSSQLYVNQTSHAQLQLLSDPGSDSCYDCLSQSSVPSSPRSAALPSPPDSPLLDPYNDADLDSLSSFPSVSSSVFFSSGMASPIPYSHPHSGHLRHYERDVDAGLIIPSLTLPAALPQPTPYGQTLGELSLMLVGPAGAGKTMLAEFLADSDDIVDVLEWEDVEGGRILHASTDWVEEHDPHGLERFEGSSNLSFFELDGFSSSENPDVVVENVLKHVHNVFNDVHEQLPNTPSSPLLHSLLASPHSTLITALIYVTATPLTTQDHAIIAALSSKVPVIPFSTTSLSSPLSFSRYEGTPPRLASFQPQSHPALRIGLFRSPQTVASLRNEATDRFMRWREVERVIKSMDASPDATAFSKLYIDGMTHALSHRRLTVTQSGVAAGMWSKALWETQLSEDVARRLLSEKEKKLPSGGYSPSASLFPDGQDKLDEVSKEALFFGRSTLGIGPGYFPALDPLHLRSLFMLSLSIFAPKLVPPSVRFPFLQNKEMSGSAGARSTDTLRPCHSQDEEEKTGGRQRREWRIWRWGLAIVGVFCAGVGFGLAFS